MPPSKKGIRAGFSPTLYLLDSLSTTIKGSVPKVKKVSNSASTNICDKPRKANIHICVDIKDHIVLLALCNGQEVCARTAIIPTVHKYASSKMAQTILEVLERSGLSAVIEAGVAGGCNKILQAASSLQEPISTPSPIDNVTIPPGPSRRCKKMSTRKTAPVNYVTDDNLPLVQHLVNKMAQQMGADAKEIKVLAKNQPCQRARDKTHVYVCPQDDHVLLLICTTADSQGIQIVFREDKDVQEMARMLGTALTGSEMVTSLDCIDSPTDNAGSGAGKEDDHMAAKREDLSPRELEVFDAAVKIANGEEGRWIMIKKVGPLLKKALPENFPQGSMTHVMRSLKKKDFFREAGRGNIRVNCLWPEGKKPDSGASDGANDDPEKKDAPPAGESLIEQDAQQARLVTEPSIHEVLFQITSPDPLNLPAMADEIMAGSDLDSLRLQARLVELGELIGAHPRCPQTVEDQDGNKVIQVKI